MVEIIVTMLRSMKDNKIYMPIFIWSTKECKVTAFEDRVLLTWEKPLEKVLRNYPDFNHSNTVIVDHKTCRLERNPTGNLVISTAFYVVEM